MALPKEQDIGNVNLVSTNTQSILSDSIYNMKPNVEKLAEQAFDKDKEEDNKTALNSTVSSSAVTDMSDPYANQMRDLTSDNTFNLTAFQDTIPTTIASANSEYYSTGANLKSKKQFGSQFDNVNEDNVNAFYTTAQNIGGDFMSAGTTLKEGLKESGMAPLFGAVIGNPAMAIIGGAASWIGLGLQQEKDKNNFLKQFGEQGFSQELLNTSFPYAGKNNKTGAQFLQHILYNSNNPGYALKYNAYGGKKGFSGNHIDALSKFINEGIDNNIFPISNILNMSANRYNTQGGSNAYMTTTAAQKALEGKGWQVKGRVAIAPDGTQYLDGKIWGGKDLSNVIKKKYGYVNTVKSPSSNVASSTPTFDPSSQMQSTNVSSQNNTPTFDPSSQMQSTNTQPNNTGGGSSLGSSLHGSGSYVPSSVSSAGSSSSNSSGYQPGSHHFNDGGKIRLQNGGPAMQTADNLEMVNEPGKDMSGVADDVPRQLDEGDFVINAPAVIQAGKGDIERMVNKAVSELQKKGVKLDFGKTAQDIDKVVEALVSNGEVIIPKVLAEQIGYDRLQKINNRGKEEVKEIQEERQQIQQQPRPQGMMGVQMGGQISLDENKNQPIAVPRESFAGQSSVGRRLLSPMSPEAQDDEKELNERSQSFEGFLRPIKLNQGDVVGFTDEEFNNLIMRESSGNPEAKGDKGTGDTAVGLTQVRGLALEDVNKELGTNYTKEDLLNPDISKLVGKTYLNQQLKRFGSKELALAAYNLGPTDVETITNGSMLNYYKLPNKVKNYVSTVLNKFIPDIKPKPNR